MDVRALAADAGFALSDAEAAAYAEMLATQQAELESLARPASQKMSGDRDRGRAPTVDEDPYRAWLWRCQIEGREGGLLTGRTVSFKDHISVAGLPLTFNARPLEHLIAEEDAGVVERVLAAGGTVIGKNSLSGITTQEHAVARRGPPLNPRDVSRATGGSSSGSAVAVAAGEVDIAFGGDQGGSVRVPAAYCGVLGMKPTYGLISHAGATFHSDPTLDHIGPLARSAADLALALEAVAGYDGRDPRQGRDIPERLDVRSALEAGVSGVRIGILEEGFAEPLDPHVRAGVLAAVEVLGRAGASLQTVSVREHGTVHPAISVTVAYGVRTRRQDADPLGRLLATHTDLLVPYLKANLLVAELSWRGDRGAAFAEAARLRPVFARAYDRALAAVDVLVMPTCPTVAPAVAPPGRDTAPLGSMAGGERSDARNTRPFNFTGHPSLAVPCGTAHGLPISMQLVGRFLDDALLLRVARALEVGGSG